MVETAVFPQIIRNEFEFIQTQNDFFLIFVVSFFSLPFYLHLNRIQKYGQQLRRLLY